MTHSTPPAGPWLRTLWRGWALFMMVAALDGASRLWNAPGSMLRAHPLGALLWLVTVSSCAVACEAVWKQRPWRFGAAILVPFAYVLTIVAGVAEWLWSGNHDGFVPTLQTVSQGTIMVFVFGLAFLVEEARQGGKLRVRRPAARRPVP